jgi:hypothetical protein
MNIFIEKHQHRLKDVADIDELQKIQRYKNS